jgi:general secretion pathway protein I
VKQKKLEFPDFSSTLTAQDGGADQTLMTVVKQLTQTISKSIKEVQVTVIYKPEGAKKTARSFSNDVFY